MIGGLLLGASWLLCLWLGYREGREAQRTEDALDRIATRLDTGRCWSMADDDNPDCPIGSARCVRLDGHDAEHVWEAP
jgi:hypothetical protein